MPESGALALKPTCLTYAEVASVSNGALTAPPFLRDLGQTRRGHRLLVHDASGSVGTAAVQLAKALGAGVTGVCSTPNLDLVRSLGADRVVDYTQEDFVQMEQAYDVIFDAVGKVSFSGCRDSLAENGTQLTVAPTPDALLSLPWASKEARFAATGLRSASQKADDLRFIMGLLESGQFRAVIDRHYSLEQAADGSQNGICVFPNGRTCDEWAYYRGECGLAASPCPTPAVAAETTPTASGGNTEENASGGHMSPGTSEAIADWWGVIKSTEPGAQYDDYFERQDLGQTIYSGIDSMDPAVQARIKALRDSGKVVHLYGTLLSNAPDYNGSQIQVARIETESLK